MKVTLVQATNHPVTLIAKIASICYDSTPRDSKSLVKFLYLNGHHSVFEHIHFTFKIEGISRACSHQLVRHRLCSFTQRSQRYCDSGDFPYIVPPKIKATPYTSRSVVAKYDSLMDEISDTYKDFHTDNIPKEDARYLLPNACCTDLYLSTNLRELIHIANERLCIKAQWEIREVVAEMCKLVDEDLQYMLVAKCKSNRIICHNKCKEKNKDDNQK